MTRPKARRTRPPASQLDAKADYADAFEVAISDGDLRTAEQAFRAWLGPEPGAIGRLVWWVHRHVLRFRLGPVVSSDYAIGWKVVRSDPDQFAAQAYDTLFIAAAAIDKAGEADPGKIRDALTTISYRGVMGPFSFAADRDPADASGVVVIEMRNGQFHLFD